MFQCFWKVPNPIGKREARRLVPPGHEAARGVQRGGQLVCCLAGAGTNPGWLAAGQQLIYLAEGLLRGFQWYLHILLTWLFLTKSFSSVVFDKLFFAHCSRLLQRVACHRQRGFSRDRDSGPACPCVWVANLEGSFFEGSSFCGSSWRFIIEKQEQWGSRVLPWVSRWCGMEQQGGGEERRQKEKPRAVRV